MTKSNLLLDEQPLVILPQLAVKIGLNEAVVLQQFHYWLERSTNVHDGFKWIYNTYAKWQEQFPWWSDRTLRRTINKLESDGILIAGNYNKMKIDNTKWYRIDYHKFNLLVSPSGQNDQMEEPQENGKDCVDRPCGQNGQTDRSKWTDQQTNLTKPLPETTTEITTDSLVSSSKGISDIIQFWDNSGFGFNNTHAKDQLLAYLDDGFDSEVILKALHIASEVDKRTLQYIKGILHKWENAGAKNIQQVNAYMEQYKTNNQKGGKSNGRNEKRDNKSDGQAGSKYSL